MLHNYRTKCIIEIRDYDCAFCIETLEDYTYSVCAPLMMVVLILVVDSSLIEGVRFFGPKFAGPRPFNDTIRIGESPRSDVELLFSLEGQCGEKAVAKTTRYLCFP